MNHVLNSKFDPLPEDKKEIQFVLWDMYDQNVNQ